MRKINENAMRIINGGDNVQQVSIGDVLVGGNFVFVQKQNIYTKITKVNVNVFSIKKYW